MGRNRQAHQGRRAGATSWRASRTPATNSRSLFCRGERRDASALVGRGVSGAADRRAARSIDNAETPRALRSADVRAPERRGGGETLVLAVLQKFRAAEAFAGLQ